MPIFYATGGRGTEDFIRNELENLPETECLGVCDGKVVFSSTVTTESLVQLKTVERIFVNILRDQNFCTQGKQALWAIQSIVEHSREKFEAAYDVWNGRDTEPCSKRRKLKTAQFRVSCKGAGRYRQFTQDISKLVGVTLNRILGWRVNLRSPDFEISVQVNSEGLIIGIPLTQQPISCRGYLPCSGLRSTVAWIVAMLADIQPVDLVVDPMCGCSTILVEAAKSWQSARYVGFDICEKQLEKSRKNILKASVCVEVIQADCRALPLPGDCADCVVCDLPFGIQHLTIEAARTLYPRALAEMHRVLKPGGKAVLLTSRDLVDFLLECAAVARPEETQDTDQDRHCDSSCLAMDSQDSNLPDQELSIPSHSEEDQIKTDNRRPSRDNDSPVSTPQDQSMRTISEKDLTETHDQSQNKDINPLVVEISKDSDIQHVASRTSLDGKSNPETEPERDVSQRWIVKSKHYLKLGETDAFVCVLNKR